MIRLPLAGRRCAERNVRANSSARDESGPETDSRGEGEACTSSDGQGIAAPSPPKCRPSRPARSSTPKCRRAGASTKTLPRPDIVGQQRHRLTFPGPSGLVYDGLQPRELVADLL